MSISYKDTGVNIKAGADFVSRISNLTKATHNKRVLNALGSFASLYDISGFSNPVLVSGTDGVGTKIMLAIRHNDFSGIGQDCVAMCVNDIVCHGAKPLFFLDYIACGTLSVDTASQIVESISAACLSCDCALVGGETAEMPDMYKDGDYDVAGFTVGIVDKHFIIDGSQVEEGDIIIGCASHGLHSNGYSLVRAIFSDTQQMLDDKPLYHTLLQPTRLYVSSIQHVLQRYNNVQDDLIIRGLAHITGGGLIENIPRSIPSQYMAHINTHTIPSQRIYEAIRNTGKVAEHDMWATFNMGVGMVLIVKKNYEDRVMSALHSQGEHAFIMGNIMPHKEVRDNVIVQGDRICLL